ncbi:MAG TPA: hypothetical protein VME69_01925 [Methylocella sp.]|nr:hypothetical protein [Methylocella sp.]
MTHNVDRGWVPAADQPLSGEGTMVAIRAPLVTFVKAALKTCAALPLDVEQING